VKKFALIGTLVVACAVLVIPQFSTGATPAKLSISDYRGPLKMVGPGALATMTARCPKGRVAIAGQELNGANFSIYSAKVSPRTWEIAVANDGSDGKSYESAVGVVCARGVSKVKVSSASLTERHALVKAWKAEHRR